MASDTSLRGLTRLDWHSLAVANQGTTVDLTPLSVGARALLHSTNGHTQGESLKEKVEALLSQSEQHAFWATLRSDQQPEPDNPFGLIELSERAEPPPRTWRVKELVPDGAITLMFGDSGIGKSFLVLMMAMCIALGRPFAGLKTNAGRVLFVDAELDADEHTRRAYKLARGLGLETPPPGLVYARLPYSLATEQGREWLVGAKWAAGADVVALDSLTYGSWGIKIAEVGDVGSVMRALQECGTSILADHTQWEGASGNQSEAHPIGSFMKKMATRSMIQVNGSVGGSITIRPVKNNFDQMSEPVYVALKHEARVVSLSVLRLGDERLAGADQHMRPEERVLMYLSQAETKSASLDQLADEFNVKKKTVSNWLTILKRREQVSNAKDGIWHIAEQQAP